MVLACGHSFPGLRVDHASTSRVAADAAGPNDPRSPPSGVRLRPKPPRRVGMISDRLLQLADSIPEVIWVATLEPEERIVYTSPSFERVWGLPLEKLYRNPRMWAEGIHPEDRTPVVENYSRWIAGT